MPLPGCPQAPPCPMAPAVACATVAARACTTALDGQASSAGLVWRGHRGGQGPGAGTRLGGHQARATREPPCSPSQAGSGALGDEGVLVVISRTATGPPPVLPCTHPTA